MFWVWRRNLQRKPLFFPSHDRINSSNDDDDDNGGDDDKQNPPNEKKNEPKDQAQDFMKYVDDYTHAFST